MNTTPEEEKIREQLRNATWHSVKALGKGQAVLTARDAEVLAIECYRIGQSSALAEVEKSIEELDCDYPDHGSYNSGFEDSLTQIKRIISSKRKELSDNQQEQ